MGLAPHVVLSEVVITHVFSKKPARKDLERLAQPGGAIFEELFQQKYIDARGVALLNYYADRAYMKKQEAGGYEVLFRYARLFPVRLKIKSMKLGESSTVH